jgi:hypothetical protein
VAPIIEIIERKSRCCSWGPLKQFLACKDVIILNTTLIPNPYSFSGTCPLTFRQFRHLAEDLVCSEISFLIIMHHLLHVTEEHEP